MGTFRPQTEPASTIYDAFQAEAAKRAERPCHYDWIAAEREVVYQTAVLMAQRMGLREPTMQEVIDAECGACGHVDYGAKWARGVRDAMLRKD